jgi:hypothetical protein
MAWGEPKWKTMERMKRLTQQYPELDFSTPDKVMEEDNDNLTNHTAPVSQFSQDVMQLGAYAAQQHTDLLQHEAQSYGNPDSQLPDFGDTGSLYDENEFKPRTWQDAASPLDLIAPGSIGGEVMTHLDRARGAVAGFATSGDRRGWGAAGEALEGFKNPGDYQGRDTQFGQMLPDNDLVDLPGPLPNLSLRDVAGGVGDQVFDPTNYIPGLGVASEFSTAGRVAGNPAFDAGFQAFKGLDDAAQATGAAGARGLTPQPIGGGSPISEVLKEVIPGEKLDTGLLRRYEGRTNTQGLVIARDLDKGNELLEAVGIGKPAARGRVVTRTPEVEELFKALHGEGEVPLRLKPAYDDLKAKIAAETQASLDFDPKFMARPEYFPRGWKAPKETNFGAGKMGAKPGFKKPRNDATFTQMLEDGWEPVSWNPYEMVALRRVAGAEFREQTEFVRYMQDVGAAVKADGPMPEGYRVPRVGPAFEGKPKIIPPAEEGALPQFAGFSERWAVPDRVADVLENAYGTRPRLALGGKNILPAVELVGQASKRAKLFGSLFQQIDFATRTGWFTFGGAVDSLTRGHPIEAVRKTLSVPAEIGKLAYANVSPARRTALRDQILDSAPIFKDRPGITLKGISEAGWSQRDITILPRDIKSVLDDVDTARGVPKQAIGAVTRNLGRVEDAIQNGLFEGVYPQAQITIIKNNLVPAVARAHPEWSDAQIMGSVASEINKMFSTLPNWQTIFSSPGMRALTRSLIFSTNEPEALIKQAFSTVQGPNKRLWAENWVGGVLFLGATANVIHYAATGEPLPMDRYKPLTTEGFGPLPVSYNSGFMSPDVPGIKGRNDTQLTLDLMGQMDTIFRVLDPQSFVTSRFSTLGRAAINQASGTDFQGRPLDSPKERIAQAVSDLFGPIGLGEVASAVDPTGLVPEGESRLGTAGQFIQSAGANLRAETNEQLRNRAAGEVAGEQGIEGVNTLDELAEKSGLTRGNAERQVREAKPNVDAELDLRRAERAESDPETQQRVELDTKREENRVEQNTDDTRVLNRDIDWKQWGENKTRRASELRGFSEAVFGDEPIAEPKNAYEEWLNVIRENEGPDGVDWDAVDAWVSQQDPARQKFIDDNTGLYGTDLTKRRSEVGQEMEEAGYFDIRDKIWDKMSKAAAGASSPDEFEATVREKVISKLLAAGRTTQQAEILAQRVVDNNGLLNRWREISNNVEQAWIVKNRELAARAFAVGYFRGSNRKLEEAAIMRGSQQ